MTDFEDNYLDIIKKASMGSGYSVKKLAELTNVPQCKIRNFFKGQYCDSTLILLSKALKLDYESLKNHANNLSHPPKIDLEGLYKFQTKFSYRENLFLKVNHYLLVDDINKIAFLFDTGTNAKETIDFLKNRSISLGAIFITHQHKDHILAVNEFLEAFPHAGIFAAKKLNNTSFLTKVISSNKLVMHNSLKVYAYETPGHTNDGLSFKVDGLSKPLIFVGDAIFAHSQGGIKEKNQYKKALEINRTHILSLPSNTIIAPGHGPLTTVEHEKNNNPFYAKNLKK